MRGESSSACETASARWGSPGSRTRSAMAVDGFRWIVPAISCTDDMEDWFAQMAKRRTTPQRLPDAVREAVERTLQTTLGGAQQTRGRAQEALDDVVHGAEVGAKNVRARVREAIETTRPATSDDIRELREEIA